MRELWNMFRNPSMIKACAFCAAIFGLMAVMFKNSVVIIPEVTEIRPCNILAIFFGIYFGPAGAWGCAIGNLIGDMGGSLSNLSPFGFVANFLAAWFPYRIWCALGTAFGEPAHSRPSLHSPKWGLRLALGGFCSVAATAALLGVVFDVMGSMPAANTFAVIGLNNAGVTLVGAAITVIAFKLPARVLPYWKNMMPEMQRLALTGHPQAKVVAASVLFAAATVLTVAHLCAHGLGLAVMDSFGNMALVMLLGAAVSAATVLCAACWWRPDPAPEPVSAPDNAIIEL